jgi:type I restriction enzyme S subunit
LNANLLANYEIILPKMNDQIVIANFVHKERKLKKETELFTKLLDERRSALISAAVTGQIDVRETI